MFRWMMSDPDFKPIRGARRAFTLVEMLVAVALTSLVMIFMWNLFVSGSKSMAYGTWYSGSIAQLRRSLTMLRQDIGKATYPSLVQQTNINVTDGDPNFYIGMKSGPPVTLTKGGGTQALLHF